MKEGTRDSVWLLEGGNMCTPIMAPSNLVQLPDQSRGAQSEPFGLNFFIEWCLFSAAFVASNLLHQMHLQLTHACQIFVLLEIHMITFVIIPFAKLHIVGFFAERTRTRSKNPYEQVLLYMNKSNGSASVSMTVMHMIQSNS